MAQTIVIPDSIHRGVQDLTFLERANDFLTSGRLDTAAQYCTLYSLQCDPTQKDFSPTRNGRLLDALTIMQQHPEGEATFRAHLLRVFQEKSAEIVAGKLLFPNPTFEITGDTATVYPNTVPVQLTAHTQQRAREWNSLGLKVIEESGVQGLIDHPAVMVHALGLGHWLDVGNLMVEVGYIGDRLTFPGSNADLYRQFGVSRRTFCLFTHIKHLGMYPHTLVDGQHLGLAEYLLSYIRIQELMIANAGVQSTTSADVRLDTIISPGSWWFDPDLQRISPHLDWVQRVAGRTVVIGPATDFAPKQLEFALSGSKTRRAMYESGEYTPMLTARIITLREIQDVLEREKARVKAWEKA